MAKNKTGFELIQLTPTLAAKWLGESTNPRPIERERVRKYARDMSAGNWKLSHQGMARNEHGLRDGFHRCSAVVESGVTISVWVLMDVDEIAVIEMDNPKVRSDTVSLRAAQVDVGSKDVAVLKAILMFPNNYHVSLTRAELVENLEKYKPALEFIAEHCKSEVFSIPVKAAIGKEFLLLNRNPVKYQKQLTMLRLFCAAMRGEQDNTLRLDYSAVLKLIQTLGNIKGGGATMRRMRFGFAQAAFDRFQRQDKVVHLKADYNDYYPLGD